MGAGGRGGRRTQRLIDRARRARARPCWRGGCPGCLPALSFEEALEATCIWSVAGRLKPGQGLLTARPFRAPHHTISVAGLVGGGTAVAAGRDLPRAHRGVLFLDELLEFRRPALEALRQPLEDGGVSLVRAHERATCPARFMLVGAMNPCPCGHAMDPTWPLHLHGAGEGEVPARISGPLLDRFDLHIEVRGAAFVAISSERRRARPRATVRERVERAREVQRKRYAHLAGIDCNAPAEQPHAAAHRRRPPTDAWSLLGRCIDDKQLSRARARPHPQLARTHRGPARATRRVTEPHIAEAFQLRCLDRPLEAGLGGFRCSPLEIARQGRAPPFAGCGTRRSHFQGGDMSKITEKLKAVCAAIAAIEKQFGKGAIMPLGGRRGGAAGSRSSHGLARPRPRARRAAG